MIWFTSKYTFRFSYSLKNSRYIQRWVNQCIAGHDKNRRTDDFENVGQNWAWAAVVGGNHDDSNAVASGMVQKWYDEVNKRRFDLE